jgi:hypothetical protein
MNKLMIAGAVGVLMSTAAMAQTSMPTNPHPSTPATSTESLRQHVATDMQKAGFTDVHVRPDSFLVHAKNKDGVPVTILIDPDSMTEVVGANGTAGAHSGTPTSGTFTTVPSADMMGSKIIGTDVHNSTNQDIGTIKDVAYSATGMQAYIVGVGGFLGMGDHYVAVNPSAVHLSYDAGNKSWHATMNATADQLKAAPEFKYPS